MITLIRRICRSIHFRYYGTLGWLSIVLSGVHRDGSISVFGHPIIYIYPGSRIHLGTGTVLTSESFATALGVNHPVVLRTLDRGAEILIGARVGISGSSICAAHRVEIGEDSMLGANVMVTDTDFHVINPYHRSGHTGSLVGSGDVVIGRRVFIGANSIILKGSIIGDNSVIGAGSIVTGRIPENTVAAGNPCRVLRSLTSEELQH